MPMTWTPERERSLFLCLINEVDQASREKFDRIAAALGDGATMDGCR